MISVVIPIKYNNGNRIDNFECCLESVKNQTYKNYEIIIAEDCDDKKYFTGYQCDTHLSLNDPLKRPFNLSWCRNTGASYSKGDIILFLDSDFVFDKNYFKKVSKIKSGFATGSNCFVWTNQINTAKYYKEKDLSVFKNEGNRFQGYSQKRRMGYGCILIMKRDFYKEFGGFCENFFGYGWEDNESADRIMKLLNVDESRIERINSTCYHLWHNRDISKSPDNKVIYEKLLLIDYKERCELLKDVGKIKSPELIGLL